MAKKKVSKLKSPARHLDENCVTGICLKDQTGKVLYQNQANIKNCGSRLDEVCHDGCMGIYNESPLKKGKNSKKNFGTHEIFGGLYDLVMLTGDRQILTICHPIKEKMEHYQRVLKEYGLTKRENEIVELVLQGRTNSEIAKRLFISKPTLRTHLNNIYRKLPQEIAFEIQTAGRNLGDALP